VGEDGCLCAEGAATDFRVLDAEAGAECDEGGEQLVVSEMGDGDERDEEGLAGGAGGQVLDGVSQLVDQISTGVPVVERDGQGGEHEGEDAEERPLAGGELAVVDMVERQRGCEEGEIG
jgi:hypothetical protein